MAQQNINQYVYPNWGLNFALETYDMSLTSDERGYNQEVVFSPYLIAQTYGNRLPFYFDINNPLSVQDLTLTYKDYNRNNIFVSQNFYNPKELDITCFNSHTSCDIGLTGIDNGLVTKMTGETITFTEGLFSDDLKFNRMYFDRRLKLFQVTGNTQSPNVRFSGFNKTVLYEVVSKYSPYEGRYHELYGGFYQGFYKLFGYDYEIFPERMNRGWSVEMLLKPRLVNEYIPTSGETTLNKIYPQNKNIFFYLGARAENKFYHHANGTPNCFTGYTRVTSDLYNCIQTCACCNRTVTDSRCIYVYPPRSLYGVHDPHVNYGCHECRGIPEQKITCGCNCNLDPCETCGWECQTHTCASIIEPTPSPTPTPTSTPTNCLPSTPTCTETCSDCNPCYDFNNCNTCVPTGYSSVEYTCETNPLFDAMSNALSFKLCGDPKNPQIGVKVLRFTGGCETSGTCSTSGLTYTTGYTVTEYCSPGGIYPTCYTENPAWLDEEHWFQLDAVWERYTWLDDCDLWYRGGLGIITQEQYLESLAHNSVSLINVPYTSQLNIDPAKIELVNLNERWLDEEKYRRGRLKIYINGKIFYTIEDFQEIIPRALSTDKEKQVGVPFNISWGGGTQGLRENLTFSSCTLPYGPYQQDPECFPVNDLTGTTFNGMNTNIVIEQNFAGTFEGGISQFRMYVTPLSAPEVKHNFSVLKNTFRMFNPDCPDCSTEFCPPDDFTYTINDISTTTTTTIPVTPTNTSTPTPTLTETNTPTPTTTIPVTPTPTITLTPTPTITLTPTPTPTNTMIPTPTPTNTMIPTPTPTPTPAYFAYLFIEPVSGSTNIGQWMYDSGRNFFGFTNYSQPTQNQTEFNIDMNVYVNFSGWTNGTFPSLIQQTVPQTSGGEDSYNNSIVAYNFLTTQIPSGYVNGYSWFTWMIPVSLTNNERQTIIDINTSNSPNLLTGVGTENTINSYTFTYTGTTIPPTTYRVYTTYPNTIFNINDTQNIYMRGNTITP